MIPMAMSALGRFCQWLEQTSLSQLIQSLAWIVPTVQTVHILAISAVAASALMINLRLIGIAGADQSVQRVARRFLPVIWWAMPVLLASGAVMIIGEPARSLQNPVFQLKMLLVVTALALTGTLHVRLDRDPAWGESGHIGRAAALWTAAASLALWTGIVFAGRWIAYF